MKRMVLTAVILGCLIGLAGCGTGAEGDIGATGTENTEDILQSDTVENSGTGDTTDSTESLPEEEQSGKSLSGQLQVIAECRDLWMQATEYAGDFCQYAVTDLDHNGRYEIIVADVTGTGIYTYSRFYEVNESYDGLNECETDFAEGDSQPDIVSDTLETYTDDQGHYFYTVYDLMKNGAAEYYENVRELTLSGGKICTVPIAYRTTIYDEGVPTVTCEDADGNTITEEEYESAAENYFAGYSKSTTSVVWQEISELGETTEQIVAQLSQSAGM